MGCPVPKVAVHAQAGSALLKDIPKIKEIVKSVVETVNVPVTVKIRSGWDNNHINAVEVAKAVEEGTYVSPQAAESAYDQEVSKQAIDLVKSERIDDKIKDKAKKIIVEEYKENERRRIKSIKEEQKKILEDGKNMEEHKQDNQKNEESIVQELDKKQEENTDDETIV